MMAELIYSLSVKMARAGVVTATDNCWCRSARGNEGEVGSTDEHLPCLRDDRPGGDVMGGSAEVGEVRENIRIEEWQDQP